MVNCDAACAVCAKASTVKVALASHAEFIYPSQTPANTNQPARMENEVLPQNDESAVTKLERVQRPQRGLTLRLRCVCEVGATKHQQ